MGKKINKGGIFNIVLGIFVAVISAYINVRDNSLKMSLFILAGIFFIFYGIAKLRK